MNSITDYLLIKHGYKLIEGDNRKFAVWLKDNVSITMHMHDIHHLRCWHVLKDNKRVYKDLCFTEAYRKSETLHGRVF